MPNHVKNTLIFNCDERKLNEILAAIQYEKEDDLVDYGIGTFDFNKVIPMPKSLKIESGTRTDNGINLYLTSVNPAVKHYGVDKLSEEEFNDINIGVRKNLMYYSLYENALSLDQIYEIKKYNDEDKLLDVGKVAVNNLLEYGATTWYEWSRKNWDTKWNSYDTENYVKGDNKISFSTAWSAPHAVVRELSKKFSDVEITHIWADEDMGSNCGEAVYYLGENIKTYCPEKFSRDAYDIAFKQWGFDSPEDCGFTLSLNNEYINIENDEYELIELFGEPALFSNSRFTDTNTPVGMFHYDIRHSDDGDKWTTIEPTVRVNHAGSIIIKTRIDFGTDGYIEFDDDTSPNFTGVAISIKQYMDEECNPFS